MTKPVALIYAQTDADRFLADRQDVREVVCLSPVAYATLKDADVPVTRSCARLGDREQAWAVARMRRVSRYFRSHKSAMKSIGPAAFGTFRRDLHVLGGFCLAVWSLTGRRGPWVIWTPESGWQTFNNREDVHKAVVALVWGQDWARRSFSRKAGFAPLTVFLSGIAAKLCRGEVVLALTAMRGSMGRFGLRFANRTDSRLVALRAVFGDWRDPLYAALSLLKALTGRRSVELLVSPENRSGKVMEDLGALWRRLPDPVIVNGLGQISEALIREAALCQAMQRPAGKLLHGAGAGVLLTDGARWGVDVAACAGAGDAGMYRILGSHGTHTVLESLIGNAEHFELADGMLWSDDVDATLVQSPIADAFLNKHDADIERIHIKPLMWGRALIGQPESAGPRKFRILQAGTLKRLSSGRPWVYESADEFADGLVRLATCVAAMKDVELVIRMHEIPECSEAALRKMMPDSPNILFENDGLFPDEILKSDVLVSYSSTTIEEALALRRPVLLWGGSARYRHLPAATDIPQHGDRHAVYFAADDNQLAGMIDFIRDHHFRAPLSEEEVRPFVWPSDTMDEERFIELLRSKVSASPSPLNSI